jgi:chromate transporter
MEKPSYKEAFLFWLKLGFISFGGPTGQIAIMYQYLVEKKKWISNSKFLHALNYCMLLPGPEAQQLAIYTGWLLHGTAGGLAAGILFVLPSMFILLALSIVYVSFGTIPVIIAIFSALKPAVIAIVILALIKIAKKSLHTGFHYLIALLAFVFIFFTKVPFPAIIISTILIAILVNRFYPQLLAIGKNYSKILADQSDESNYYLNSSSPVKGAGFIPLRFIKQVAIVVVLWFVPFMALRIFSDNFSFWGKLSLFFTKAALVTFGGAYAVLPYVAQVSVDKFHWLTKLQMVDGLALGETTPGPLIMVLTFVGFVAGYNQYGTILAGTIGLLLTTFYTFLPCFFFIFAGAPVIEKTQENKKLKSILSLVTAAVAGVILNLTIYLGIAIIFPNGIQFEKIDFWSLSWIIASLIILSRFKMNIILWIIISAFFGFIKFILVN